MPNIIQQAASKIFKLNLPYASAGSNIDDQSNLGWTPLSANQRPLGQWQQDRMFEISAFLYRRNPIAHRVVEIMKSFVVGDGVAVRSANPEVDRVIQLFWNDRRNNWRTLLRKRVSSLSVYGEAFWPTYVNPINGSVIVGNASPLIIDNVVPNSRNSFEAEVIITKQGRAPDKNKINNTTQFSNISISGIPMVDVPVQALRNIKLDTDIESETYGYNMGDAFFFTINSVLDDLRGLSDIYTIGDWLDIYDNFLFNRAQKQSYMNQWLWDIKLEGMNESQQEEWLAKQLVRESKQRSGRLFVHNEKVERKVESPKLEADDAQTDAQAFMQMIWGGTGLSSQAFGSGGVGRQDSGDMNEWVFHTLSDRQVTVKNMLHDIFDFVIDQAIIHDELKEEHRDAPIRIFMPKISVRDLQRVTQALRNLGSFLGQAFRANTQFEFDDNSKKRIQDITTYLLDHIDLSTSPDFLVDLDTGDTLDKSLLDLEKVTHNGRN
jgi:hypothetical protein